MNDLASSLTFKTARLVIALAWGDGKIEHDELNAVKELVFALPGLSEREWARLEMYLDSPVDEEERLHLADDVLKSIRTTKDKQRVIDMIASLLPSGREMDERDWALVEEIRHRIESEETGMIKVLGGLGRMLVGFQKDADRDSRTREKNLEDYIRNKFLYDLRQSGQDLELDDHQLQKLCCAAALMGRVAFVDQEISMTEKESIHGILASEWHLDNARANLIVELIDKRASDSMEFHYLTFHFYQVTSGSERFDFVKSLFRIAYACNDASHDEMETIRDIAYSLKLTNRDFIRAKLATKPGE
jgi:uncharacterized tellurite resistance protein B-like protein